MFQSRFSPSFGVRRNLSAFSCAVLSIAFLATGCANYGPQLTPGALSLSASSFDFKTVAVGQTVKQPLTVTNRGQSPIQLTGLNISNKEFVITGPSVPRTILPANSLSYTVSFSPTALGKASGTLTIASDAAVSSRVDLSGSGEKTITNLVLTPSAVSFGNLALKSTAAQNVTMQNTGDISMTIQGITVAGAGFGYSSLSPGFSLAPNQKVTFQVWFSPKIAGAAAATVSFLSPNLSSPEVLSLTGNGVSSSSGGGTPPPPPTQHTVHLNWNASTGQVVGYRVYRSETSGGSFAPLNGTAIPAVTYDDATVTSGTTYYYVVTSVDASGNESVDSNQVTAVIPAS